MERYEKHVGRAREMLAQGFHTKQARKDAAEHATRAYEEAERIIRDKLLAGNRESEAYKKLYWSFPACHVLKEKHYPMFAKFPEELEMLKVCAALRAEIIAAPEKEKPKTKKQVEEEIRNAEAMTCQICARKIYAELGVIAHHGYERPGEGWQTDSCDGARKLPYEADRAFLEGHIKICEHRLARFRKDRNDVKRELSSIVVHYEILKPKEEWQYKWKSEYKTIFVNLTRETCEAALAEHPKLKEKHYASSGQSHWEYFKERDLKARDAAIAQLDEYIKWQTGRFNEWPGVTHRFEKGRDRQEGKWVKA